MPIQVVEKVAGLPVNVHIRKAWIGSIERIRRHIVSIPFGVDPEIIPVRGSGNSRFKRPVMAFRQERPPIFRGDIERVSGCVLTVSVDLRLGDLRGFHVAHDILSWVRVDANCRGIAVAARRQQRQTE